MSALQLKMGGYRSPPQVRSPSPIVIPTAQVAKAPRRMSKQLLDMELAEGPNPQHEVYLICMKDCTRKAQMRANGEVLRACS